MKIGQEPGKWFSAHLWKTDFKAVARTREDAIFAYDNALKEGDAIDKKGFFPLGEKAGVSINETTLGALKRKEITTKLLTVIPAVAGIAFLSEAYTLFRESSSNGPIATLMGMIGLAAITFGQYITWETGDAYGQMHDWADKNGIQKPWQITQYWPGSRSSNL